MCAWVGVWYSILDFWLQLGGSFLARSLVVVLLVEILVRGCRNGLGEWVSVDRGPSVVVGLVGRVERASSVLLVKE